MTILPDPSRSSVTGVILAGGAGRRLGGLDKGLVCFESRPLVEWVMEAASPQVDGLVLSANRNLEIYAGYGWPVVQDEAPGFQGPLMGILSAMRTAPTPWLLTLPCDDPQPPADLLQRLARARRRLDAETAVAECDARVHWLHALLPVALADDLAAFLENGGRKVGEWHSRHRVAYADFSDAQGSFANLNSHQGATAPLAVASGSEFSQTLDSSRNSG
jgi:molybdenum cofactor guanylyltransferase